MFGADVSLEMSTQKGRNNMVDEQLKNCGRMTGSAAFMCSKEEFAAVMATVETMAYGPVPSEDAFPRDGLVDAYRQHSFEQHAKTNSL